MKPKGKISVRKTVERLYPEVLNDKSACNGGT